jgi:YggT family protein
MLWFDVFMRILRISLFVAVALLAVVCLLDWLVRTRRINPFSPIARRMRTTVDPLMAPMERRIVRAGGLPTSAPWWTLIVAVICTIVLVSILNFIRAQVLAIAAGGASNLPFMIVHGVFSVLRTALIVRVISSWFGMSPYSPWIRWAFQITEWFMAPLRQIVPTIGVIDITPIVAYFLLVFTERALFALALGSL